jgi:hypothetical protein
LSPVGSCSITASQAGNASHGAATPVAQSFTVNSASQTITFGALSNVTYGVSPFTVGATASSGLAVSFASTTTSVCTVAGSMVTIVAAGLFDHGESGGQRQLWGGDAGGAKFHGQSGIADDRLRRAEQRDVRRSAVHDRRHGEFGAGGELRLDHDIGLHGGRQYGHDSCAWLLLDHGEPGGQRQLCGRDAGTQSFTVNSASQTITFGALSNVTYGVSPFTITATASSGLAVSFASSTTSVCTVAGNTVTIVAGGVFDHGEPGGQRELCGGDAGGAEFHG